MESRVESGGAVRALGWIAARGRWCLVLGLLAGLALPDLAQALRPALPFLVGLLLFLTAFRVGARAALGGLGQGGRAGVQVLVLQAILPLALLAAVLGLGWTVTPFLLGVILMLAAPSVTGAPNFAIMNGADPAPAMRILVMGTALFPLLVLPVFWLLPHLGGVEGLYASLRLIAVILLSVGLGFGLRHLLDARIDATGIHAVDGANALALGVIVVGLMSALGPLLRDDPGRFLIWVSAVILVNFGLQVIAFAIYRAPDRVAVSMISGNRNIALFLIALPDRVIDPLLIFIGCYQIPMYLTPILLRPLHDRA